MKRIFALAGPAYLVTVEYMDPGNWATDLEGGSRFGYALIWGAMVTLFDTFLLLAIQRLGIRKMDAFVLSLITGSPRGLRSISSWPGRMGWQTVDPVRHRVNIPVLVVR